MNRAIEHYRYHEAAQTVWHFIYDDFCDWYIELKKLRFVEGSGLNDDWRNLLAVFESAAAAAASGDAVSHRRAVASAGRGRRRFDFAGGFPAIRPRALRFGSRARDRACCRPWSRRRAGFAPISASIRNCRLKGGSRDPVDFRAVQRLAGVTLTVGDVPKTGAVRSTADFDLSIDVPHGQMEAQRKRLEKERDQLMKNIANSQRQLVDEVFLSKAPGQIRRNHARQARGIRSATGERSKSSLRG